MALTATVPIARRRKSFLHVGLSLLTAAIVLVGFWPEYYGSLLRNAAVDRPVVVHAHAVVFSGWLVLFVTQAVLAATGRIREHLRFGRIGAWYGAGLIVVGVYTAVVRSAVQPVGQREILLWVTLVDMAVFSAFFGAALWFRRKPQLHKRLMTAAAVSLVIASVARMTFLPGPPAGQFVRFLLWSAPVLIAIAHDARYTRRLHPVYVMALVMFAFRIWSPPVIAPTAQWTDLTARVLALVGE
jgi:hypothetical protein